MIQIKLQTCPHCKDALMEGCACMMCPNYHKLFKVDGEEVDDSNFFIIPSKVNWDLFNNKIKVI